MTRDPSSELPLKPLVFSLLVALAEGDKHGYALMKDLSAAGAPARKLFPASLYRTLREMRRRGFVEVADGHGHPSEGPRRRVFAITDFGRSVARNEARRMASLVEAARSTNLLADGDA